MALAEHAVAHRKKKMLSDVVKKILMAHMRSCGSLVHGLWRSAGSPVWLIEIIWWLIKCYKGCTTYV